MSAEHAAALLAQLTPHVGRRPDLVMEDGAGRYRYLAFFEVPCRDDVRGFLASNGFSEHSQERTPHNPEALIFASRSLSLVVQFSDPAANPHVTLLPAGYILPETSISRLLDNLLAQKS